MIRRVALACPLLSLAQTSAHALKECPVNELDRDEVIKAIAQAPTCKASFDVLDVCRNNAGGDVELAGIVTEKCEKTFLAALKPDRKRAYEDARRACYRKYAKKEGTMYASAQAICEANVAVRFAK